MVKNIWSYISILLVSLFFVSFFSCATITPTSLLQSGFKKNEVINVADYKVFPVKNQNETDIQKYDRWLKIKQVFEYCVKNKYDLYFPAGTYDVGSRNFPFGTPYAITYEKLLDCRNITIFGEGRGTILKTSSILGADVLQLNMVKNLKIKNFAVTADLSSNKRSGSNGISITNGFDNIILDSIYIYNLPHIDKGNYIDGGKGLTLQFDPGINSKKGSLVATNIKVENCAYGFRFDGVHVSDLLKADINIKLQMEANHTFQGFSMSFGVPSENVKNGTKLTMDVDAVLTNAQQYVSFSRVVGGNYRFTLNKTIDNKEVEKDYQKNVWYKADPIFFAFLSNYSKETNTSIKGNVGVVDYKIWMGAVGSVDEPFNLVNRTENNIFNFDIEGTSTLEDFKTIEYLGNSILNTTIFLSPKTLKNSSHMSKKVKTDNTIIIKY